MTSSPGFRSKMYEDIMPGGTSGWRGGGGEATRTFSMMTPFSPG